MPSEKNNHQQIPATVKNPVSSIDNGSLLIVKIDKLILVPIVRTTTEEQVAGEETITEVVERAQRLGEFDACINGVWYDYDYLDAMDGNTSAAKTVNEGVVLLANGSRYGRTSSNGYYAAQRANISWEFGFGDLPTIGFRTGAGGLCPLVINGLRYGKENKYRNGVPSGAPKIGEPDHKFKSFLMQRSSAKFAALLKESARVGKSGFGVTINGTGYIIVQPHGASPGVKMDAFREKFIDLGCSSAMACDGSDSVFMYRKQQNGVYGFDAKPGYLKNASMSVALGFKSFNNSAYKAYQEYLHQEEMRRQLEEETKKGKISSA
ncbi:MAG: hypothetical protein LBI92_09565 [Azoarcus sp.]|jgi:hypothetical protein|nr:hypothetical protein [Azoarcus sp.]